MIKSLQLTVIVPMIFLVELQYAWAQNARLTNEKERKLMEYSPKTVYKTVMVNGLKIFYREAGQKSRLRFYCYMAFLHLHACSTLYSSC